jgi:hypothetical protein
MASFGLISARVEHYALALCAAMLGPLPAQEFAEQRLDIQLLFCGSAISLSREILTTAAASLGSNEVIREFRVRLYGSSRASI